MQVVRVGKRLFRLNHKCTCFYCGKNFMSRNKNRKFCSHKCYGESKLGVSHTWGNKIGDSLRGVPKSKEHIKNVIKARSKVVINYPREEKHWAWKGDRVGYDALHDWVGRYKGYPKKCDKCGTKENRVYHWANKNGRYKRDLADWLRLCVPCHSRLDKSRPYSYYKKSVAQTGM